MHKAYVDYLVRWLEEMRQNVYQLEGYVLGISGGIDSAVCAHLIKRTGAPVRLFMLPTAVNDPNDLRDGAQLAEQLSLPIETISIQPMFDTVCETLKTQLNPYAEREGVLWGNLMARLRMVSLYTIAQSYKAVVIGTDNAAEYYTGYFTKYGDGAADVLPLARLSKGEVYELARYLGVVETIINKAPSAGLWQGQTDEDEMGVSYAEIDAFLKGKTVSKEAQERIDFWHQRSHHKRCLPPMPEHSLGEV